MNINKTLLLALLAMSSIAVCSEQKKNGENQQERKHKEEKQKEEKVSGEKQYNEQASYDLLEAAERGDLDGVNKALADNADVNTKRCWGNQGTPLILATKIGHMGIVKRLLQESTIDVNARDEDRLTGSTALMLAVINKFPEIVAILVNVPSIDLNTVCSGCSALAYAVIKAKEDAGYLSIVRQLLLADALYLESIGSKGLEDSPDGKAEKSLEDMDILPSVADEVKKQKEQAITLAQDTLSQQVQLPESVVSFIVELLSHIRPKIGSSIYWLNKFHRNLKNGMNNLLSLWLYRNDSDDAGYTPFLLAVYYGNKYMIKEYINHNRNEQGNYNLTKSTLKSGHNAVAIAQARGYNDIAQRLSNYDLIYCAESNNSNDLSKLLSAGANVNGQGIDGDTALISAAQGYRGNKAVIEILLQYGANETIKNDSGTSFHEIADKNERLKFVYITVFLENKTPLLKELVQRIMHYYHKPFLSANQELSISTCIYFNMEKVLEDHIDKSTIELVNLEGHTPLLIAIASPFQYEQIVTWLLSQGADINAQTKDGLDAIQLAEQQRKTGVVALLKAEKTKRDAAKSSCTIEEVSDKEAEKEKETKTTKESSSKKGLDQAVGRDQVLQDLDILIRANDRDGVTAYLSQHPFVEVDGQMIPTYKVEDSSGMSPLRLALHQGKPLIAIDLMKMGATLTSRGFDDYEHRSYQGLIHLAQKDEERKDNTKDTK